MSEIKISLEFINKDANYVLMDSNFQISKNGHHFIAQHYSKYTQCNMCSKLLWGVGPQGYVCGMSVLNPSFCIF